MQLDYVLCPPVTCGDKLAAARAQGNDILVKQLTKQCTDLNDAG